MINEYAIRTKWKIPASFGSENNITQENCHPNVVKHKREKEIFMEDFLFCKNTKSPIATKSMEVTSGGKKYIYIDCYLVFLLFRSFPFS